MRYHHAKVFLSFLCICFSFGFLNGQPWLSDPDKKDINFFEVQKQFNEYWKDKEVPRSSGYKPFKRWEWYWENRVLPDGSFPKAGFVKDEFEKYVQKHQVKNNGQRTVYPWLSLGPSTDNGGYAGHGRINSIGFHPTDNNKICVGTAGGGFWISEDGGNTWMNTTDDLGALGVSGIAVDPVNPLNIYIATGDGDAADNYSIGVYKSTDGGLTFAPTGLDWSSSGGNVIRRIIFDPSNANTLFVATNSGVYKTTDAGTTWNLKQSGNFYDIEANPNSASLLCITLDNLLRCWRSLHGSCGCSGKLVLLILFCLRNKLAEIDTGLLCRFVGLVVEDCRYKPSKPQNRSTTDCLE